MAHKKGVGSSKNGRESESKRLGVKIYGGQFAKAGNILVRQRGTQHYPGENVGMGKDHTLYALVEGTVTFIKKRNNRSFVSVEPIAAVKPVAEKPKAAKKAPVAEATVEVAEKAEAKKAPAKAKAAETKEPAKKAAPKKATKDTAKAEKAPAKKAAPKKSAPKAAAKPKAEKKDKPAEEK